MRELAMATRTARRSDLMKNENQATNHSQAVQKVRAIIRA